jgi:methyltransferase (TIGR00027 family)
VRCGPSITARAVALARSELERPLTTAGDPDAERRLYAALRMPARWPISRSLRGWVAARTSFFDDLTLTGLAGGIEQIVIVGAGYDGRALRFGESGVRFFEVDQRPTQLDKRERVEALGGGPRAISYVAHDVTHGGLSSALAEASHSSTQRTLFICEGLLLYLTVAVAEDLLADLRSCAATGSLLGLSTREVVPGARLGARVSRVSQGLLLAAIGEPRRSLLRPGELEELLGRSGWTVTDERAYLANHGGSRGMLTLAEARA